MRASSRNRTFPLFVAPRKPGASVMVWDNGQRLQIPLPAMMALGGKVVPGGLDKRYPIDFEASEMRAYLAEERARPEVTEITLAALNQLEEWVRALSVEG